MIARWTWVDHIHRRCAVGVRGTEVDLGRDAPVEPMLLKPEDAAKVLNLARSTVYKLIGDGTLPSITVGRSRRVPVAALRLWVARQWEHANSEECTPPATERPE